VPDIKLRSASPILNSILQGLDTGWTWDITLLLQVDSDPRMVGRRYTAIVTELAGTIYVEEGGALSELIASGIDISDLLKNGEAITILMGSGLKTIQIERSGSGQLIATGSGLDVSDVVEACTAIASLLGSGVDAVTSSELGLAISELTGSGVEDHQTSGKVYEKYGIAIAEMTCYGDKFITQRKYHRGATIVEEGKHPLNMMPEQVPHMPFETVRASDGIEEQNQLIIAIVIGLIMARSHRL